MSHRARGALAFIGAIALASACSGRSLVIGGDPLGGEDDSGSGGSGGSQISSGGTAFDGGGTAPIGGSSPGGTTGSSSGGSIIVGGKGGTTGGVGAAGSSYEGGEGGAFDPYPPVAWDGGQGYRNSCPQYTDGWGFTCWNVTDGATSSCGLDGTPYCNACSCAVPCETFRDCPSALDGKVATCISSPSTAPSCFVSCTQNSCPDGMTCADYPGRAERVCVWVTGEPPK